MGFRFRKSVKVAPGVKINLSKSGGSLSLGGRGATVNLSSRGVRSTYSIPGTGISYATQTSSEKSTRSSSYSEAEEGYRLFQTKIDSLSNILRHREKQPFNWERLTVSRVYQPEIYKLSSFTEPEKTFSKEILSQEIRSRIPSFHVTKILMGVSLILLFYSPALSFSVFVLASISHTLGEIRLDSLCAQRLQARLKEENEKYARSRQRAYEDYLARIELEKAEHQDGEAERKQIWNDEERYRERLRNAVDSQDLEPLADLLKVELSNEDLPIPLAFDIEFLNVSSVRIFMKLPEFDMVPEERMRLTKTGKLSARRMAQRDRFKLYSNVCTGLTLHLTYETFRVIHSVDTVELHGSTEQVNPANGHREAITSLHIMISKQDFERLNLDDLDPTAAFTSLDGKFACSRKGKLLPLRVDRSSKPSA